jgi:TolB-like protein
VTDDDRLLADGFQSDILAGLSRNHTLDVVAAGSLEQFGDMAISATEAGQKVGATHVLDGSVQGAGDRIRIQARLIDVRTAVQVWAEAFDREFMATRLFAVLGEIVKAACPRPVSAQTRGDNLAPEWICPVQPWGPSSSWMRRAIAVMFRSIASK